MSLWDYLQAFAAGFCIETACVYWVHYSERGQAEATSLCSMLIAQAQVSGLGEAIRDTGVGHCYVLGFGAGTWLAVRTKGLRS